MKRPKLNKIPLSDARPEPGVVTLTMSVGQWDLLLEVGYNRGFTLLELDDNEIPVAAYRKKNPRK
jgi:hypothetical protein